MAGQGREQVFLKILVFFSIITAVTGFLNLVNSGGIGLGDLGSGTYMQTIPGQVSPNVGISAQGTGMGSTESFGSQDYTTAGGYNHNITKVATNFISGDTWTRADGIGYEVSYIPPSTGGTPSLAQISIAGGSSSANNNFDYVYHVYNQFSDRSFYTLVAGGEGGANAISGFYIKYGPQDVSIVHSSDILHPIQSIPVLYANEADTVETVYDPTQGAVAVYVDGNEIGTFSNVQWAGLTLGAGASGTGGSASGVYYVGVAAEHWGVSVSSIEGNFIVEQPFDFWSDAMNKINGLAIMASQFLALCGTMLGLTSNPLVPFWLWAIIGLPCVATLILIYIQIARGD
jgi:hypothetical protein